MSKTLRIAHFTSMSRLDRIRLQAANDAQRAAGRSMRTDAKSALRNVQRTLESTIRALPRADRGPVACQAGCAWCCHLRVMATAPEVFALLDYLESNCTAEFRTQVRDRAVETARRLRALPPDRVLTVNLPCPVLDEGRCGAYAGRPLNCRAYHSLDAEACRESFEHPDDLHRGHPQLASLARAHAGTQAGLIGALTEAGHDARQYELVTALAEAIEYPETRERLQAGERVFLQALTLDER